MSGSRFFAILLIFLGVLALLNSFGVHVAGPITVLRTCWPLLLTVWGLRQLTNGRRIRQEGRSFSRVQQFFAIVFAALGIALTGQNFGFFRLQIGSTWGIVWSLFLIYLGISVLGSSRRRLLVTIDDSRDSDETERMSSIEPVVKSFVNDISIGDHPFVLADLRNEFVVGDMQMDLSKAILSEGEVTLEIIGGAGDITLRVPKDMDVFVNAKIGWVGDINVFGHRRSGANLAVQWHSPEYAQAQKRVRVFLELRIGTIDVRFV